jgi:hypothetical protein
MRRINRAGYHRAERHRAAVIKIRYRDVNELSPGLHPMAERRGRVITVYVIPGLTAAERNATLRRLRLSGRRGYGPRLPAVPLAFARFADRSGRFARARAIAGRSRHRDRRCLPGRGADRDLPGRLATSRTAMR